MEHVGDRIAEKLLAHRTCSPQLAAMLTSLRQHHHSIRRLAYLQRHADEWIRFDSDCGLFHYQGADGEGEEAHAPGEDPVEDEHEVRFVTLFKHLSKSFVANAWVVRSIFKLDITSGDHAKGEHEVRCIDYPTASAHM